MELAFWGFLGGVAAEVLRWFQIREELHKGVPEWAKSWPYWVVTFFMAALGGLLVWMYQSSGDVRLSEVLAFNIGASAPLILTSLTSQLPFSRGSID